VKTAVVTIAHGRHEHLRRQLDGLGRADPAPDLHLVVALDDPDLRAVAGDRAEIVDLGPAVSTGPEQTGVGELPLAAGRNAGAQAAVAAGAELLVFLDVDCIPAPALIAQYAAAAADPAHADAVLCGPVAYLPPPGPGGYDLDRLAELATAHRARPDPAPGVVQVAEDRRLFWSLSFAVTAATWARIGGFHAGYVGYGGEDTDFIEQAHAAGVGMRWVGGANAFHQHHRVSVPPVEHLDAIVRNARVFHQRWGWWPMGGWLDAFAERGLAEYDPRHGWRVTAAAPASASASASAS
jgi:GT2 family glycosyltransferase